MRKFIAYNFITLNGFYKDQNNDISWHRHGSEESAYSEKMLSADNILLFGRITYEMMASYWTTPHALQTAAVVAKGMNKAEKIVFSSTLNKAEWNNTRVVKNALEEINTLKQQPGKDLALLGSGSVLSLFAEHGLIDEYQLMVDPVAIGIGTPIFHNINKTLELKLTGTKVFKSGVVLLCYQPG